MSQQILFMWSSSVFRQPRSVCVCRVTPLHYMAKAYELSGCMWKWIACVCVYIVDPNSSQQSKAVTGGVNMKLSSAVTGNNTLSYQTFVNMLWNWL